MQVNNNDNIILNTDGYKFSHADQMPSDATNASVYLEARGGPYPFTRFFGAQALCKRHLVPLVTDEKIEEAESYIPEYGAPWHREGWERIKNVHDGRLPIEIWAAPEGTDVPIRNVMMQVVGLDPKLPWLPTFVETLMQQVYAPSNVCTISGLARQILLADLIKTAENPYDLIDWKLVDFGLRAEATMESGAFEGAAFLANFKATDTVPALKEARIFYNEWMAGGTIPAGEHSEILMWGPDGEEAYFENLFDHFLKPGKMVAAPIDTYDMEHCLQNIICGTFRDRIRNSGGTFVARPDSGDPTVVVPWALRTLAAAFGAEKNAKGYLVLHPSVRVIFGDGMDLDSLRATNLAIIAAGFSTENCTYGMGGGLLRKHHRDTQKVAMKASAVERGGLWLPIAKTIKSDPSKASKPGRLALVDNGKGWSDYSTQHGIETVTIENLHGRANLLRPIYRMGEMLVDESLSEIRERIRDRERDLLAA